jgi:hypothetical protein
MRENIEIKPDNLGWEGEEFIYDYLQQQSFEVRTQERIKVSGDKKSERFADFYLPDFNIFVEFFGLWNSSKEDRSRYREKKNLYFENNIPCIYLYPENLGFLDYIFKRRMIDLLSKLSMKKQLKKYRSGLFWGFIPKYINRFFTYLGIGFVLFLISDTVLQYIAASTFGVAALYQIVNIYNSYIYFFSELGIRKS